MPTRLESAPGEVTSQAAVWAAPLHVLIVGASFGGLALAYGLRREGVPCSLYEARRSYPGGRPGYRVAIDSMGSRGLKECLPPDLFATALRDAMLLARALRFVRANRVGLRNAVAAYETEMIRFNAARVADRCCPR